MKGFAVKMENDLKKITSEELLELYVQINGFLEFLDKENTTGKSEDE